MGCGAPRVRDPAARGPVSRGGQGGGGGRVQDPRQKVGTGPGTGWGAGWPAAGRKASGLRGRSGVTLLCLSEPSLTFYILSEVTLIK